MSFVVEIDPVDKSVAGNALLTASVGAVSLIAFLVEGVTFFDAGYRVMKYCPENVAYRQKVRLA